MTLVVPLIVGAVCAVFGYRIGAKKGRPVQGLVLGFALGLIGLWYMARVAPPKRQS